MLCSKFELIPTSIFRVTVIFKNEPKSEKSLYYSPFYKMAITRKIEVGINSNLLHSISTSICIRKCNKNFRDFEAIFWKIPWAKVQGFFQIFAHF